MANLRDHYVDRRQLEHGNAQMTEHAGTDPTNGNEDLDAGAPPGDSRHAPTLVRTAESISTMFGYLTAALEPAGGSRPCADAATASALAGSVESHARAIDELLGHLAAALERHAWSGRDGSAHAGAGHVSADTADQAACGLLLEARSAAQSLTSVLTDLNRVPSLCEHTVQRHRMLHCLANNGYPVATVDAAEPASVDEQFNDCAVADGDQNTIRPWAWQVLTWWDQGECSCMQLGM